MLKYLSAILGFISWRGVWGGGGGGRGVRVKGGRVRGSKQILENSVKTRTLNAALHAILCT